VAEGLSLADASETVVAAPAAPSTLPAPAQPPQHQQKKKKGALFLLSAPA